MKKVLLILLFSASLAQVSLAQTGISAAGTGPDAAAMLDVIATDKGFMVPRVALTALNAAGPVTGLSATSTSLLVYNTATAGVAPNDVTPGFYYWNNATTSWIRILSGSANPVAGNDIDFGTSASGSIDVEPILNFVHTVSAPAANNLNLNAASGFAAVINANNGTTGATQTFRIGNGAGGSDVFYVQANGTFYSANQALINSHAIIGGNLAVTGTSSQTGAATFGTSVTISPFTTAGIVTNTSAGLLGTTVPGTSGYLLSSSNTGTVTWVNPASLGVKWNALTDPDGALTLSHGTNATVFNFANTTTTGFAINATAQTTGSLLSLNSSNAASTGNAFAVSSNSTGASANGIVRYNFTGAHTNNGFQIDDATTAGTAMAINTNALVGGTGLAITGTGTGVTGNMFRVQTASTGAFAAGGVRFNFTGAHTGSGLLVDDVTAAGTAMTINANSITTGAGNGLVVNANGMTSSTGNGLLVSSSGVYTGANGIFAVTANNATTGTVAKIASNGLTSGTALDISSTSTAGTNSKLLNLTRSGTNGAAAMTNYGVFSSITNTNATSATNIAGYFNASGASPAANYAIIVPASGGDVGIGTSTPINLTPSSTSTIVHLHDAGTAATDFGQFNISTATTTSGNRTGVINFAATAATSEKRSAVIESYLTAASGANASGDLRFSTSNAAAPTEKMRIGSNGTITFNQPALSASTPNAFIINAGAHTNLTLSAEATDINFNLARTVQFAAGALTTQRAMRIQAPTYAFVGASTITNAATVAISGAPVAGSNATITNGAALYVESGNVRVGNLAGSGTRPVYADANGNLTNATGGIAAGAATIVPIPTFGGEPIINSTSWQRVTRTTYSDIASQFASVPVPSGATRKYYVVIRKADNAQTTNPGSYWRFSCDGTWNSGNDVPGHGFTLNLDWGSLSEGTTAWVEIPPTAVSGGGCGTSYWKIDARMGNAAYSMRVMSVSLAAIDVYGGTNIAYAVATTGNATNPTLTWGYENINAIGTGQIGIGTVPSTTYKLDVNGGKLRTAGIDENSDIRLKKDVNPIYNALTKVAQMRGVTYNWRKDEFPERNMEAGLQYGLIAQELETIIPELVTTDEKGWKSIEYSHLVPVLIEAIKELDAKNNAQQTTINTQQQTNSELKASIENLLIRMNALENNVENKTNKAEK